MSGPTIFLRHLAFDGPDKVSAQVSFSQGLNVICGASDTGKSFVAESMDFMLGGKDRPADIPERVGYDMVSLTLEALREQKTYLLQRATAGGDFRRIEKSDPGSASVVLQAQHQQGRTDTLSAWLLNMLDLAGRRIRKNAGGDQRSLSFRDLARLVILQQGEISSKTSPYLTGQHVSKTAEVSALKLILTGVDDSAVVRARPQADTDTSAAKVEVLEGVIEQLREDISETSATESELREQQEKLQATMALANATLRQAQLQLDARMQERRATYHTLQQISGRREEINNLLARFELLQKHYNVDLDRLAAIAEVGKFISHLPEGPCPLCGAASEHQHGASDCDGNVAAVATAAEAEQAKVRHLLVELAVTVRDLGEEEASLSGRSIDLTKQARLQDREIGEILSPTVGDLRDEYSTFAEKAADIRRQLSMFERIADLEKQKVKLQKAPEAEPSKSAVANDLSKSVTNDLALAVERILAAWNFPGATRVTFDESSADFICDGKPRGSFGAGFRAIISAAASVGLLEYCLENGRPHPGFLVLESPLLAYWKPESSADNLKGSDLKDRFYEYLNTQHKNNQIIVIENEHPPATLSLGDRLTVFTRNPLEGRFGFFPVGV
ncbi:AAA family ATPase [Hydrocarboniphaga effusa]|uniref:AAA family ATPase n=1 Tax=Hydrocarboniphaga effusa TaxID=243629 RepID=UPI0035B3293D